MHGVYTSLGKFVQHHGLQIGDTILIHQESRTNKYVQTPNFYLYIYSAQKVIVFPLLYYKLMYIMYIYICQVIETRKRAFPECAHAHPPLAQFF